jgi:hypothetical protein
MLALLKKSIPYLGGVGRILHYEVMKDVCLPYQPLPLPLSLNEIVTNRNDRDLPKCSLSLHCARYPPSTGSSTPVI